MSPLPASHLISISLDDVVTTAELARRPSRPPDYAAENRALVALARAMTDSPNRILKTVTDMALPLCRAGSAGISLAEKDTNGETLFRWRATAGSYAPLLGATLPRAFSPCGTVLDRNATQLMTEPARFFPYISDIVPPVHEVLLVPFYKDDVAIGTVWVVSHSDVRFDAEDAPLLESLSRFAAAAVHRIEADLQTEAVRSDAANLLEGMTDGFLAIDSAWRVTHANAAAERFAGRSRESLLGGDFWKLFPDTIGTAFESGYRRTALERVPTRCEAFFEPSGQWFEAYAVPVREGGIALYFKDVSDRREAGEALRQSEERLRLALQSGGLGTWDLDLETKVMKASDTCKANYGRGPGEVFTYEDLAATVLEDDRPMWRRAVDDSIKRSADLEVEYRVRWPDDSLHWVHVRASCTSDESGRPVALTGVSLDITDRKLVEDILRVSEERFRLVVETVPGHLWTANPDGAIDFAGPWMPEFTGVSSDSLYGSGWKEVLHPDDIQDTHALWSRSLMTGDPYRAEFRIRGKDGRYRWFHTQAVAQRDAAGRVTKWYGYSTDADDLRTTSEALREQDRRKDEFLATLAHELRNPLAPVRNGLAILRMAPGGSRAAVQAREMMERQLAQLVRLVDDLMDVSRVNQGKVALKTERVELRSVVTSAVETSRPLIEAARHEFSLHLPEEPVWLDIDPARVSQVLGNLLNNAAKYTPDGGRISVTAGQTQSMAIIRVTDNGTGIPEDMLPKVFDLFIQVGRTIDRAQGGLGIGLSLVKKLVELHGGSVGVESPGLGAGTTFTVRLPLAPHAPDTKKNEARGGNVEAVASRRVLIVDDNVDGAESLAMLLEISGHTARVAHDGPSAIDLARTFIPEVVFLDIGMPGMNGYEVAKRLRTEATRAPRFLVALTGWGSVDDKQHSKDVGFDFHLTKPVEVPAVEAILARFPAPETRKNT